VAARKNVGSRQTKPARLFPFPRGKGLGVRLPASRYGPQLPPELRTFAVPPLGVHIGEAL